MENINAKTVNLAQGGTVQDAVKYITPEMFGAVGDGSADDSDAIIAAIEHAIDIDVNAVRGDGVYLIQKSIPCRIGVGTLKGDNKKIISRGFDLYLNIVKVGDEFPEVPEKWWDAEGAFYPFHTGPVDNLRLHVNEFYGNHRATFFKSQGKGVSTSLISCDEMVAYIIGFKNYLDPTFQSGMNKIRGRFWSGGYIACLIGGFGKGYGNSECHNIDINWCASNLYGGISLQDRSQYANVTGGTYDFNAQHTSILTLDDIEIDDMYSVEFGTDITSGNKKSYTLSSLMRGYEGEWQLNVKEDGNVTDGQSKFTVGDVITAPGFSAKISKVTVPSKKTAIYPDIIICNRTGDFSKARVAADYVGGIYGHNLFTCDIWGPSASQNPRNMAYRGLGVSGSSSHLEMYATQHSVSSPFCSVTSEEIRMNKSISILGTHKLQGTSGKISVANNVLTWAFSLNGGSNTPVSMWKVYISGEDDNIYGEFTMLNSKTEAKVISKNISHMDIRTDGHKVLLLQSTGIARTLYYNAIRMM